MIFFMEQGIVLDKKKITNFLLIFPQITSVEKILEQIDWE